MAATAISGLTALTAPATADQVIVVDDSAGDNKCLALSYLARDTGGTGAIVTGAYTLTLPATGTAALLGTANVFTATQTIPAIVTASGALTVTPAAGSNVNVVLSTTGDFVVNTNQLYIDTSSSNVGVGTTGPTYRFQVAKDDGVTSGEHFITAMGRTVDDLVFGYRADGASVTGAIVRSANNIALYLGTSGTKQAITILDGGDVGVGSTGPTYRFQVAKDDGVTSGEHFITAMGRTVDDLVFGYRADGASVTGAIVRSANNIALYLGTSGTKQAITILDGGDVGIATTSPAISSGVGLHIGGSTIRVDTSRSPASNGTGNVGEICWDASYLYVCTATNTWERVALTGGY